MQFPRGLTVIIRKIIFSAFLFAINTGESAYIGKDDLSRSSSGLDWSVHDLTSYETDFNFSN